MKLSNKALNYINNLERDRLYTFSDKQKVEYYFKNQHIPVFEKVVDFQIKYSGLEFSLLGKPLSTFYARLFTASQIKANTSIDYLQIKGNYYFYCGDHKTVQAWLGISQNGGICTLGDDDSPNIVYSSFEKFVETYAFENLIHESKKHEDLYYYDLIDKSAFDSLTQNYFHHTTANDNYNKWMSKDNLIIHQGIWLDRPASYVHIYGDNKKDCDTYILALKNNSIIK